MFMLLWREVEGVRKNYSSWFPDGRLNTKET
jgi:hypothetical protein